MKKFWLTILTGCCLLNCAQAKMPEYQDDAEFKHCLKITNDIDACVQEQTKRALNAVKLDYRQILGDRKMLGWNGSQQANVAMLRDMYAGWTAYRNRLCSLSNVAAKNVEAIVTEKYSCTLYHTLHHKAHLDKVINLLNYNDKNTNSNDVDLFKIDEHDEAYNTCRKIQKNTENECLGTEFERYTQKVKNLYNTLLHDEFVGKWNNGPDLQSGNYRDMYDSWIAYRNRICSLAAFAYDNADIGAKVGQNECLVFLTKEHAELLENALFIAHTSLDVGFEDELGGGWVEEPENDGGLEEGQTITPLQNKIETKTYLTPEDMEQNQPVSKNVQQPNGPAWAQ